MLYVRSPEIGKPPPLLPELNGSDFRDVKLRSRSIPSMEGRRAGAEDVVSAVCVSAWEEGAQTGDK